MRNVTVAPRARLAYATDCTAHLLNVPAQGMTEVHDDFDLGAL